MRRSAWETKTMKTMIASMATISSRAQYQKPPKLDFRLLKIGVMMPDGMRAMMLANRIIEMPLPMPCSEI